MSTLCRQDAKAKSLALLCEYAHAAREDTLLFPAWRKTMNEAQLHEISEKFEDIENQQFGKDGLEDAVQQVAAIEEKLGLSDLSIFTASSVHT